MEIQALKLLSLCTVLLMVIIKSKVYCEMEQKPVVLFNMKCDGPMNKNCVLSEYDKEMIDGSDDKEDKMSLAKRAEIINVNSENKEDGDRSYKIKCLTFRCNYMAYHMSKRSRSGLRVACVGDPYSNFGSNCIPVEGLYIG